MFGKKLPKIGKSSFWHTEKKLIVTLTVLSALTVAGGFYFYSKSEDAPESVVQGILDSRTVPEDWLSKYFNTTNVDDPSVGGIYGDPDDDLLNNYQEYVYGTDPTNRDSDGDLYFDGTEVAYGTSPLGTALASTEEQVGRELKKAGINITREEVRRDFAEILGEERKPMVREFSLSQLNIIETEDQQVVQSYLLEFTKATAYVNDEKTQVLLSTLFEFSDKGVVDEYIKNQSQVIDQLLAMQVPAGLAPVHLTYIKMYDGLLGMGKFARSQLEQGIKISVEKFYPEIQYASALDTELNSQKMEALQKFGITI